MTWIAKQQFQETELGVREVDPLTATGDLTSVGIDDELSEAKHTLTSGKFTAFHNGVAAADTAQNRCDTSFEFFGAKGFWQIIICP